jgi:C4-dicarboxylate transporter, DctM subunit
MSTDNQTLAAKPLRLRPWQRRLIQVERGFSTLILTAMVVLTVIGALVRLVAGESLAGLGLWTQSLNLWLAFAGALVASRVGKHLALSTGELLKLNDRARFWAEGFTSAVATAVTGLLAIASMRLVQAEMGSDLQLPGGIPMWVVQCIMPAGFALMALRLAWHGNRGWKGRVVSLASVLLVMALVWIPPGQREPIVWAGSALLLLAVALGAPLFTGMGGIAMLLFFGAPLPVPITAVPAETYRIVADPTLPTLPLFTLAGYLMAEGGASKRLVGLFKAWVGWIPGGTAATAILVCAFFTTFTGASGVTILALGGLLLPILLKAGYTEKFSIGLLTAAGSIGLLFPPSLPVILYGVAAREPIDQLYLAGLAPGLLLVGLLMGLSLIQGLRVGSKRGKPDFEAMGRTLWGAKWEILMPVLVIGGIFGGVLTIVEAAALTAAWAFIIEVIIHRDLHPLRDVPRVFVECATVIGGVMIILGVALGFTSYLVDAEIPMQLAAWVDAHVANKLMFILLLNLFLLVVGCLMDIYSAIMVVVPLIIPIGAAFGINPMHLGILFLANLELGYLTPPVGMNLFLASFRFDKPLTAVYRMALPFLGVLALGVLLIAYVPPLTTWPQRFQEPDTGPTIEEIWEQEVNRGSFGDDPAVEPGAGQNALPLGNIDLLGELEAELSGEPELEAELSGEPDPDDPSEPPLPGQLQLPQGVDLMQELMNEVDSQQAPAPQ